MKGAWIFLASLLFVGSDVGRVAGGGCGGRRRCVQSEDDSSSSSSSVLQQERRFASLLDTNFLEEEIERLAKRISLEIAKRRLAIREFEARSEPAMPDTTAAAVAPTPAPTAAPTAAPKPITPEFNDAAIESDLDWVRKLFNLRKNLFGDDMFSLKGQFDQLDRMFQMLKQQSQLLAQQIEAASKKGGAQKGGAPIHKTFSKETKLPNGRVWKSNGTLDIEQTKNSQYVAYSNFGHLA